MVGCEWEKSSRLVAKNRSSYFHTYGIRRRTKNWWSWTWTLLCKTLFWKRLFSGVILEKYWILHHSIKKLWMRVHALRFPCLTSLLWSWVENWTVRLYKTSFWLWNMLTKIVLDFLFHFRYHWFHVRPGRRHNHLAIARISLQVDRLTGESTRAHAHAYRGKT